MEGTIQRPLNCKEQSDSDCSRRHAPVAVESQLEVITASLRRFKMSYKGDSTCMNEELRKYCPICNKSQHEDKAAYCAICGVELKIESKREFFLSLNIPDSKINIEEKREGEFMGCPFFLRKVDESSIQVVLFHDYPKCTHLLKSKYSPLGPESSEIEMNTVMLNDLLEKNFNWYHESEIAVLW